MPQAGVERTSWEGYSSVFRPEGPQLHTGQLAQQRRDRLANSEWAMLDTLEVRGMVLGVLVN